MDKQIPSQRCWSLEEDMALKKLYETLKINKWSLIAKKLEEDYNFGRRNGKQCKQRYTNYLDPSLMKDLWTFEQEKKLFQLHDLLGNRWAIISQELGPGKTDNNVKNHFYSKLRKSLRKLNKIILDKYKKQIREIQTKVLYKIIEASEEKFKSETTLEPQTINNGCELKNSILMFSYDEQLYNPYRSEEQIKQLIHQIISFNKHYKRKPKKLRRIGSGSMESSVPKMFVKRSNSNNSSEFDESSEGNWLVQSDQPYLDHNDDDDEIHHIPFQKIQTQKQKIIFPIILAGSSCTMIDEKEQILEQNQNEINEILDADGILQDELPAPPHPLHFKKKDTSIFSSEYCHEGDNFKYFEDSHTEMRLQAINPLIYKKISTDQKLFS